VYVMRRVALRWIWWAFLWDVIGYWSRNPWRAFVALPLMLITLTVVLVGKRDWWRYRTYWNILACWHAIKDGEVPAPPHWLYAKLNPEHYESLMESD